MIAQLTGVLIEAMPTSAVIDVHGMGFEVGISATTAACLPPLGGEVRLYTRMVVREDAMTLFGFISKEERTMFDRLVAVSGVGAKLALAVLSTYSAPQLYTVVMAGDDAAMTRVSGVGRKTAQRLILELKGVFEKDLSLASLDANLLTGSGFPEQVSAASEVMDDARSALLSMGFTSNEVELALHGCDESDATVEALLGSALKRLGMDR